MTVNWLALIPLAVCAAGGVGIGLLLAPRRPRKVPTTYVVYRRWDDPHGHEPLYESRSEKAAIEWLRSNRNRFGDEAGALGVEARTALDRHNATSMAAFDFWQTIEALGNAWEELQSARAMIEGMQGELTRRDLATLAQQAGDPAFEDRSVIHDTAQLILDEIRRLAEASPPVGIPNVVRAAAWREEPEPGSVMPQFTPTQAFTLDEVAKAAQQAPPPPAGAPTVTVLKPTSKPSTQTVVIPLGQVKR